MGTVLDLSPLFRSSVGFDRMPNALENARRVASIDNWPHYNIVQTGEDDYRITMAVAGFSEDELTVMQEQNLLVVTGQNPGETEGNGQYLHRGIPDRAFQRRFELAEHMKVVGASLVNGLLTVELKREIPEEMKPRRIAIAIGGALPRVNAGQAEPDKLAA